MGAGARIGEIAVYERECTREREANVRREYSGKVRERAESARESSRPGAHRASALRGPNWHNGYSLNGHGLTELH